MSSKIMCKEDFYDYAEWHEFLEDNEFRYEHLDDDTVLYFSDDDKKSSK